MNTAALSSQPLNPRFEDKLRITLAGLQRRYRCDDKSGIPGQWNAFVPRIEEIRSRVSEVTYGVCANIDETAFDYFCGVEVRAGSPMPAGLDHFTIVAQRYAIFQHLGPVKGIVDTVQRIFSEWLPHSNCEHSGHPELIERYSEDFNPDTGSGTVEIWIPIRS